MVHTAIVSGLLDRGLSPTTVAHVRATLGRALSHAERWGHVARLVDPPHVTRHEIHSLTPDEVRIFLVSLGGARFRAP